MPDLAGRLVHGPDLSGEGTVVDSYGHGTVMAGLIAGDGAASATRSNGAFTGVAPAAHVVAVKVAGPQRRRRRLHRARGDALDLGLPRAVRHPRAQPVLGRRVHPVADRRPGQPRRPAAVGAGHRRGGRRRQQRLGGGHDHQARRRPGGAHRRRPQRPRRHRAEQRRRPAVVLARPDGRRGRQARPRRARPHGRRAALAGLDRRARQPEGARVRRLHQGLGLVAGRRRHRPAPSRCCWRSDRRSRPTRSRAC